MARYRGFWCITYSIYIPSFPPGFHGDLPSLYTGIIRSISYDIHVYTLYSFYVYLLKVLVNYIAAGLLLHVIIFIIFLSVDIS